MEIHLCGLHCTAVFEKEMCSVYEDLGSPGFGSPLGVDYTL